MGLRYFVWSFLGAASGGCSLVAVCGLLIAGPSVDSSRACGPQ